MSHDTHTHANALQTVRTMLQQMDSEVSRERRLSLLNWFELVGSAETTLEAFVAYARAIGCRTTYRIRNGPELPLLTLDMFVDRDFVRTRLAEMLGTDADTALHNAKLALQAWREGKPVDDR